MAFLLTFLETAARAVRWKLLLKVKGISISFRQALSFILVGMFLGLLLPTNLGGDIAKMYDFSRFSSKPIDTASSIFMERWSGTVTLSAIALLGLVFYYQNVNAQVQVLVLSVFAASVAGSIVIFSRRLYDKFAPIPSARNRILDQVKNKLTSLFNSIQDYRRHKTLLVNTLLLSALVNILRIIVNYVNAQAVGMTIHLLYFFLFIPLTILVMMIPVSIAGIGVREGAYLYFFSQVGMAPSEAVLLSWMGFILVVGLSIIGGIVFELRRHS